MHAKHIQVALIAALAYIGWTPEAQAYIDPTAAGAALQSLYILVISALMFVALLPQKVAAFFRAVKAKLKPNKPSLPSAEQEQ